MNKQTYYNATGWYNKIIFAKNSYKLVFANNDIDNAWRMSKSVYAPREPFNENYTEEQYEQYRKSREKEKEWEYSMHKAISRGLITLEEAEKRGFENFEVRQDQWKKLPAKLYHVTTAKNQVIRSMLKSRRELSQGLGKGLGGGSAETISFTDDYEIALAIYYSIKEAHQVVTFQKSPQDILEAAREGSTAKRPFLNDIIEYHAAYDKKSIEENRLPIGIQSILDGIIIKNDYWPESPEDFAKKHGEGWLPYGKPWVSNENLYTTYYRKATEKEQRDMNFDLFKHYLHFREKAGGMENPLFFSSDIEGLARISPDDIAILVCKPKGEPLGYQVNSLGEWRTFAGDTVEIIEVLQP